MPPPTLTTAHTTPPPISVYISSASSLGPRDLRVSIARSRMETGSHIPSSAHRVASVAVSKAKISKARRVFPFISSREVDLNGKIRAWTSTNRHYVETKSKRQAVGKETGQEVVPVWLSGRRWLHRCHRQSLTVHGLSSGFRMVFRCSEHNQSSSAGRLKMLPNGRMSGRRP